MHLVVVASCGRWLRGEIIAAAEDIEHALEHHSDRVVRVATEATAEPAPAAPEPATDAKE